MRLGPERSQTSAILGNSAATFGSSMKLKINQSWPQDQGRWCLRVLRMDQRRFDIGIRRRGRSRYRGMWFSTRTTNQNSMEKYLAFRLGGEWNKSNLNSNRTRFDNRSPGRSNCSNLEHTTRNRKSKPATQNEDRLQTAK